MTKNKKKSTSGEAQIFSQDYDTTPGSKTQWLAEILLDFVGDSEHPLKRPKNPSVDRALRKLIELKNITGDDIIINNGSGYFRPGPHGGPAVREYLAKERERAETIMTKANTMEATYKGRYQLWGLEF